MTLSIWSPRATRNFSNISHHRNPSFPNWHRQRCNTAEMFHGSWGRHSVLFGLSRYHFISWEWHPFPPPPHRSGYGANRFPAFPAVCFSNTTMFALKGWREECISVTSRPRPYDLGVSSLCFFSLALGSNPASTTAEGNTLRDAGETKQQESAWQQRGEPLTDLEHSSHAATWEINLDLAMGLMLRLMIKHSFYQYL